MAKHDNFQLRSGSYYLKNCQVYLDGHTENPLNQNPHISDETAQDILKEWEIKYKIFPKAIKE